MKQTFTAPAALAVAFCFAGCAAGQPAASSIPAVATTPAVASEEMPTPESNAPADYDTLLSDCYVAAVPLSNAPYESHYANGDRNLTVETSISTALDMLIYRYYYDDIAADFEDYHSLIGDNEDLKISAENVEKNYKDGIYMQSYTLHTVTLLSVQDLEKVSTYYRQDIAALLNACHLERYAVMAVDVSWQYNEAWLAQGPQLPDGRYMRYFLLGQTDEQSGFDIYEFYWEDFMPA